MFKKFKKLVYRGAIAYLLNPYFNSQNIFLKKIAPLTKMLKYIISFRIVMLLKFIWRFHNIIYSLIAFISIFIFGIDLKEFLNTIELIYLTIYNYIFEFKLDTYSTVYKNFNPNSFNDLIKDIINYVNNSSIRIKNKILESLESPKQILLNEPSPKAQAEGEEINNKFEKSKIEESKAQVTSPIIDSVSPADLQSLDKGKEPFRDKYKLALIEPSPKAQAEGDYIRVNGWDIITSPYLYIPVITVTTIWIGYLSSNYWLPILPIVSNFFTYFFTGKPSDDSGSSDTDGGSTITASKSNIIESPKQPQINVSTSDLPTPNINIISPT